MPTARRWATTTTAELAAGHLTSASERDRCDEKRRPVWAAASYAALLGENCCDLQRVSEERRQCPSIGEPMRSIRGVQQNERRRPAPRLPRRTPQPRAARERTTETRRGRRRLERSPPRGNRRTRRSGPHQV